MEKKTWSEENGGEWDYSNKQKKQLRTMQIRAEATEAKKKKNEQKKNAAVLEKIEEQKNKAMKFDESAEMVELSDFQNKTKNESTIFWGRWWKWW